MIKIDCSWQKIIDGFMDRAHFVDGITVGELELDHTIHGPGGLDLLGLLELFQLPEGDAGQVLEDGVGWPGS
jgi:hypothetical protein